MHTLKTKLQKYQSFVDKAFQLIDQGPDEQVFEGCTIVTKLVLLLFGDTLLLHHQSDDQSVDLPKDFAGLGICPVRLSP